ncbi:MAG: isopentenyl-diphosphate Delta-isomerase [Gammaproteobacteria bacterium]|nr:isopentenyl-diphosphate Delta-isomerase [Gammaproteobacteria bacterium]
MKPSETNLSRTNPSETKSDIVSSDQEALILVDAADTIVGYLDKSACHDGDGILHRAFSVFLFNSAGQLLIQQRASNKRLWPDYWSNSCCSHPRQGEVVDVAAGRRVEQELGMHCDLTFTYKFEYSASFAGAGTEHELCWVYLGQTTDEPVINTTEIRDWRWIDPAELSAELHARADTFTPWLTLEWQRLTEDFAALLPG